METLEIALDENGNKVVVLPDIIFSNKQNIDWNEVEKYLERFVGERKDVPVEYVRQQTDKEESLEIQKCTNPELFTAV